MKWGIYISLGLFALACCLPALEWRNTGSGKPNDIMLGLRALAVGWSGIFAAVFAWYANPVWGIALFFSLLRKPLIAAIFGVIALAIATTTFSDIGRELPGDEGGVTKTIIIRVLPGCYVWMASIAVLPISALFSKTKSG